ncbi:MAG: 4Fe-4S binding protein [Candidatus Lokiarchaeota archaeon]|nr:4Fe-4S binding protein [Candidatus Lokiarchaeota archaeon]
MTEVDYYETVRLKLQLGSITAPKHEKVFKLLKIFWNEDEIKIISKFNNAGLKISLKTLAEKTGISEQEIKDILKRSVTNGTISQTGSDYRLIPLIPGIFEKYFIARKDTQENQYKVAEIYRYIIKNRTPDLEKIDKKRRGFRPLLPYDSEEKLIKINESLEFQTQVLPFEVVKDMIDKNESFAVIPCQCRLIGEYTGEPCELAPAEMGCFLTGEIAERQIAKGARSLTKEEAIEFIKETEKAGLVHNTVADTSKDTSKWICNCCSCHCGVLFPAKQYHYKGVHQTNFSPKFDMALCTKCETCMNKCPNEAIYHIWPNKPDSSDEKMKVREELCIGCGICAVNCPSNAIKMLKERDEYPKGIDINLFG